MKVAAVAPVTDMAVHTAGGRQEAAGWLNLLLLAAGMSSPC